MDSQYDPLLSVNPPSQKFGEIYCNYMGNLSFHCVICPAQMNNDEFIAHYIIHFRDSFEVKQEVVCEESNDGIDESDLMPAVEEIKLEIPQASVFDSSEVKAEPIDSEEDSSSCTDQTFSQPDPSTSARKRGRPKNSENFTEPKECGICGQKFLVRNLFKEHIRVHQRGPTPKFYLCDICGRKASKFVNLVDHFRYRHTSKVECEICKKMIRKNYRVAHMKRHTNERNFKCNFNSCERSFFTAGDLTNHLKLHYSSGRSKAPSSKKFVEPRTCDLCGQKFIGIIAYERHIQSHGTTQSSLYECDICGQRVKEKKKLLSHMWFRHSEKTKLKASCPICKKIFNKKYLNLHVKKHNLTNQKPSHICPICGKTFLVSGDLSAHIRQHNRPTESAPCNICGKTFASAASLADHNRVHSGERSAFSD